MSNQEIITTAKGLITEEIARRASLNFWGIQLGKNCALEAALYDICKIYGGLVRAEQFFVYKRIEPTPPNVAECLKFDGAARAKFAEFDAKSVVHANYSINLCECLGAPALASFGADFAICAKLGVAAYVIHVGKSAKSSTCAALATMAANLKTLVEMVARLSPRTVICLETPAGKNGEVLADPAEFVNFFANFTPAERKNLAACVDTCHLSDSMHSWGDLFTMFKMIYDSGIVYVVHMNNSRHKQGSHRDEHEYILGRAAQIPFAKLHEIANLCRDKIIILEVADYKTLPYNVIEIVSLLSGRVEYKFDLTQNEDYVDEYDSMTLAELKAKCRELGFAKYSSLRKSDLLEMLRSGGAVPHTTAMAEEMPTGTHIIVDIDYPGDSALADALLEIGVIDMPAGAYDKTRRELNVSAIPGIDAARAARYIEYYRGAIYQRHLFDANPAALSKEQLKEIHRFYKIAGFSKLSKEELAKSAAAAIARAKASWSLIKYADFQ